MGAIKAVGKRSAMLMQTRPRSACCNKPVCICKRPDCSVRDKSMPPNKRSTSILPGNLTVLRPVSERCLNQSSRTGPNGARNQMPPQPCESICSSCNDVMASFHVSRPFKSSAMHKTQGFRISCRHLLTRSPESVSSSGLRLRRWRRAKGAMVFK